MQDEHLFIAELLEKYPDLNQEEQEQLNRWLEQGNNRSYFNQILDKGILEEHLRQLDQLKTESQESWEKLLRLRQSKAKVFKLKSMMGYAAAAAIIFIISSIVFFKLNQSRKIDYSVVQGKGSEAPIVTDANPGQFKAKLILGDGSSVILDSSANEQLAQQGNVKVINKDGKLVYQQGNQNEKTSVLYNTLQTTKGQTYATVLSDGSRVWINSESSIRYPVAFTGDERKVFITGEAYFEIAPLTSKGEQKVPFIVSVNGMEVEVLGTHFNINAYSDEKTIKTTLLEGKVKVSYKGKVVLLKPGQQSQVATESGSLETINDADVEQAVAWKNGFFQFNNDDLRTVMRLLSRWYDLEVVYEGEIANDLYGGKIPRDTKASQVLGLLEKNQVHFKIQGKKIIVTP